jgi:lipid II:glycine glycyltransferase (peptidoglycan interpeptide bridge formation enzyme)
MDKITARLGTPSTAFEWDRFLEHSPKGQFEQCSGWAAVKAVEGWNCSRIELLEHDRLVGGFQVLFRNRGLFRIGYISKGPVIDSKNADFAKTSIQWIISHAKKHHIGALLVQPPERGNAISSALSRHGFMPNHLHRLIEATLLVETSCSQTDILGRMSRKMRQKIRQSKGRGTIIREGSVLDLPIFFELMLATCRRQDNVIPNPASLASLQSIWSQFYSVGKLRLTIAEIDGSPVSGLLSIIFGDRVTLWKKGWNSEHSDRRPNELLYYETLEWSRRQGYKICDLGAVAPDIARTLLRQNQLSEEQMQSGNFFNLGFGGLPVLLPKAWVWFPNPIIRLIYNVLFRYRILQTLHHRLDFHHLNWRGIFIRNNHLKKSAKDAEYERNHLLA